MTGENMIGINAVSLNVLSRRSDSVRLSLSWLRTAFSRFVMAVAFGLVLPICSQAATLNVEIDVHTRMVERDPSFQRKDIAIFVLDRSGSMQWAPKRPEKLANGETATNRNQLLAESFRERILTISANNPGTVVYLVPFSGKKGSIGRGHSLKNKSDVDELVNWSGLSYDECQGCTYLYDTLASVMEFVDKASKQDPTVKLSLYVYTDGENETGEDAEYRSVKKRDWRGNIKEAEYKRQLDEAKAKFDRLHGWKFATYAESGKMETYWRWLGSDNPPENSIKKAKDEYKVSIAAESCLLKNPMSAFEQKLSATMGIPLPDKYIRSLDGLSVPVTLQLAGKNVDSKMLLLKPGTKTVTFCFDENVGIGTFTGKLLFSDFPEWDRVALKPPAPLELTFSAPGRLSFAAVEPRGNVFIKKGTKVEFSAKATENAKIHWSWLGGKREGSVCPITFTNSGEFDVSVIAQKSGFLSAEEKIKVFVVDADVGVKVATQQPTVGKPVDFVAKATGHAEGFAWWIDGQSLSEQGAQLKGFEFKGSGKHKVKVQAYYGHGIVADSGDVSFDVAAAPFIDILQPYSGNEYEFGEKFECKASVDGDFDKVVWKLSGPAGEEQETGVGKSAHVSLPVFFKPTKGGEYKLSATAIGPAGSLQSKATITLRVAHENLGIAIISPASGAPAPLGTTENPVDLQAEVKGEHIVKVKWLVRYATGDEVEIRTVPVQNGNAKCSFRPDPSTKDGDSIFIRAEAVMDGDASSDPVVSPTVELVASRYAEIEVEAKVNGEVANGREVRFGDQIALHAVCKGDIDPTQVRWYKSVGGEEQELDSVGSSCSSPKENPDGDSLRTVYYFARAKLPDGSMVTSRKIVVYHRCPDIDCVIKLPVRDNVERVSFGLNEAFDIGLESQKLVDVKWDFGDGEVPDSADARHRKYGSYGEFTIKASGKCPNCKKEYFARPVKIKVERQPAVACFEIEPSKSSYGVYGVVHLIDKSTGDVGHRAWFLNGIEIPDSADAKKVDYTLPKTPGDLSFSLEVKDVDGNAVKPCFVTIRVRYGWLAAGLFLVVGLMVIFAFGWVICGNGPKKWIVRSLLGPAEMRVPHRDAHDPECDYESYPNMISVGDYWNCLSKKAKIPSEVMVGIPSDIEVFSTSDDESSDAEVPKTVDGAKPFTVERSGGAPYVSPGGTFEEHTSTRNDPKRFLFRDNSSYADAEHRYLRVHVDVTGEQPAVGAVVFTAIIAVFVLVGVFIASMKFAI